MVLAMMGVGDSVLRKVGDGANTLFWLHRWIGGSPLS